MYIVTPYVFSKILKSRPHWMSPVPAIVAGTCDNNVASVDKTSFFFSSPLNSDFNVKHQTIMFCHCAAASSCTPPSRPARRVACCLVTVIHGLVYNVAGSSPWSARREHNPTGVVSENSLSPLPQLLLRLYCSTARRERNVAKADTFLSLVTIHLVYEVAEFKFRSR